MLLDFEVLSLFAYDISSPSKNTSQALKIKHVKFGRFIHELSYVLNFRIFRFPRFVSLYQAAYGVPVNSAGVQAVLSRGRIAKSGSTIFLRFLRPPPAVEYFIRAAVYANKQSVCNSLRVIVSSRVVIFWHGSSVPLYLPFRHHNTRHRHFSREYREGACNSVPCLF